MLNLQDPDGDSSDASGDDGGHTGRRETVCSRKLGGTTVSSASRVKLQSMRQSMRGRLPKILEEVLFDNEGNEEHKTWWEEKQLVLGRCVDSSCFEFATGILIMVNIGLIGVEAEMSLLGHDTSWATLIEQVFLSIYTVELLLRIVAGGRPVFQNSWFLLDFFLVCVGLLALVVVPSLESSATDQEPYKS